MFYLLTTGTVLGLFYILVSIVLPANISKKIFIQDY